MAKMIKDDGLGGKVMGCEQGGINEGVIYAVEGQEGWSYIRFNFSFQKIVPFRYFCSTYFFHTQAM